MGRLNLLFEYQEYLEKISNLSESDDNYIFNELKKYKGIVEGLILTYPSNKSINIIIKRFKELNCNIEADGKIYIEGDFRELKNYIPLFNNLGYFISEITINGQNWNKEFDENSKPISIFLEPKYDVKIDPIPPILYHATLSRYNNRIKGYGLMPKSQNKRSQHPDRIYLTDDIKISHNFGKYLKKTYNEPYSICEIDTKGLNINLYEDINLKDGGFYTLNNISKDFITKIY